LLGRIKPDGKDPDLLRSCDIEGEIIPYHPCSLSTDMKLIKCREKNALIRLSNTKLLFNQNGIKKGSKMVLFDFPALISCVAIAD
jgi:hypothetical protein